MTTRLKPYPSHKDSGVEWLGEVPEHWGVLPNRAVFSEVRERDHPDANMLSVTISKGVIQQHVLLEGSSKKDSSNQDKSAYKLVRPGDIAYNKMRAWQGAVGVSEYEGIVSPAYVVQRPREQASPRYLHYLLRTPAFAKEAERWSFGITSDMWSLRPEHFRMINSSIPPLPEQTAIVRFLGWMDRRIQRLIRAKQRLIKLLEEQKQAIIHEAVTGRIDVRTGEPYPSYKDSGVEWLGEVPEHWEVGSVKRHYSIQLGKMLQPRPERPEDVEVPYLKAKHVQWFSVSTSEAPKMWASPSEIEQFGIGVGDLLVCEGGEGGRTGIVHDVPLGFIIQNALHRVRASDSCSNEFLQFVMYTVSATGWFDALNSKATIAHFTREKFGALGISFPPLPEQTAIVQYLDSQLANLGRSMESSRRAIDLLKEYRTRLISDVVTGKVDVREAAALLPDQSDDESADEPVDDLPNLEEQDGSEEEGEE